MDRLPLQDVIDLLSEEDTDGHEDSETPFFNDFLNDDISGVHISPVPNQTPGPDSTRPHMAVSPYETCLAEILEVFPDISREHVQSLYNNLNHQESPFAQTASQILIESILDGGKYPREKDRIKELKRKRSDKNSDEEEAARWKYADLRENALEYSRVALVTLAPMYLSTGSVAFLLHAAECGEALRLRFSVTASYVNKLSLQKGRPE